MKIALASVSILLVGLGWATSPAQAHFQLLLPASDVIGPDDEKTIQLDLQFTHPMEQGPVMEMGPPHQFGVMIDKKKHDLLKDLQPRKIEGKIAYTCSVPAKEPGDYIFYLEPAPYWEPAEQKMIIHFTKVVVDVLGAETGWDAMVGFPVEIEPLVRPYGVWTGNAFRGIVKRHGQPVPYARVEVEYQNEGGHVKVPNEAFVTQVVKADAQGTFTYTMPRAGWWGFAAILPGEEKMRGPDGKPVDVEVGGLIWVKTVDMSDKGPSKNNVEH
jgi:cobalt/nickel transport protein